MFRYYNMDHAIASGLQTAAKIIRNSLEKGEFRGLHDKAQEDCEEMCGR
jgi:hypothetical protein